MAICKARRTFLSTSGEDLFGLKNTLNEQNVKDKLPVDDIEKIMKEVDSEIQWLTNSSEASKEEYDSRHKDLESKVMPIMAKLYQGGDGSVPNGMHSSMPNQEHYQQSADKSGPKVEEVD